MFIGCGDKFSASKLREQIEAEKKKGEEESKKYVEVLNRLHDEMKRSEAKDKIIADLRHELETMNSNRAPTAESLESGLSLHAKNQESTTQDLSLSYQGNETFQNYSTALQNGIDKLTQFANRFYWDGDYAVAKELYEVALALGNTDADMLFRLARCHGVTPETDRAITLYKEVIASLEQSDVSNPLYHQAYNNLGGMYKKNGLYKEAELAYVRAIEINEGYTNAYYNLGLLYEEILNDDIGAMKCYERYIELDGERSAYIQKKLDEIRERD